MKFSKLLVMDPGIPAAVVYICWLYTLQSDFMMQYIAMQIFPASTVHGLWNKCLTGASSAIGIRQLVDFTYIIFFLL